MADREPTGWYEPTGFPEVFSTRGAFFQRDLVGGAVPNGLEVVLAEADRKPQASQLRDGYRTRRGGRASPVLLVIGYPVSAAGRGEPAADARAGPSDRGVTAPGGTDASMLLAVCGPVGERPGVLYDLDIAQMGRIADCALSEPDQHAAVRLLQKVLPSLDAPAHVRLDPGLRNVGLLATQELRAGLPRRTDWAEATRAGRSLLSLRGRRLVEELGFRVEQLATTSTC